MVSLPLDIRMCNGGTSARFSERLTMSMRCCFIIVLALTISSLSAQDKKMKIEFLGMKDGCPNTPKMWVSLNEAIRELNWNVTIDSLDVNELSKNSDLRAGFGSPTVLVNGKDLFGASPTKSFDPACRYYRAGLPGTKEIVTRLKASKQ